MQIIVDARERAVIPYMEKYATDLHIDYIVKTITTGDYAICCNGHIVLIIERKTYADLASSIRDGRKENINKLLALRNATGCRVAYLIEGAVSYPPGKLFSHIPYKNLRAHLDHLMLRDDVHMIYAANQNETASRLFEIAKNYSTIPNVMKIVHIADNITGGVETAEEITADNATDNITSTVDVDEDSKDVDADVYTVGDTATTTVTTATTKSVLISSLEELTKKQPSHVSVQEQLLRCLPHIGSIIATVLAEAGVTMYDIYKKKYPAEELARFKYPTGGSIGLPKGMKIYDNYKVFQSSSFVSKKIHVNILASVPSISKSTAIKVLSVITLNDILSGTITADALSEVQRSEKTKLGAAASTITQHLIVGKSDVPKMTTLPKTTTLPKPATIPKQTTLQNEYDYLPPKKSQRSAAKQEERFY